MVGKIETQLTDVEIKIGDKFHLLDKDGDGVLTMEEMAQVLQTVLKRELTAEEAIAIAEDMDNNKDGVFSIAELAQLLLPNTTTKSRWILSKLRHHLYSIHLTVPGL